MAAELDRDAAWAEAVAEVLGCPAEATWCGKRVGYTHYRCRGQACAAANGAYQRKYQAQRGTSGERRALEEIDAVWFANGATR